MDAAHDRDYSVLLSYRSTDGAFAEELANRLRRFDVGAFIDVKSHHAGHPWVEQWRQALRRQPDELDPDCGPGVVVVATEAMCEERQSDPIVREIEDAVEAERETGRKIPIVVLVFSQAGVDALQERLDRGCGVDLRALHYPRGFKDIDISQLGAQDAADHPSWAMICRAIVRVSRVTMVRRLRLERERVISWCDAILRRRLSPQHDFSETTTAMAQLREAFTKAAGDGSMPRLAIVGPGGFGKTLHLASSLRRLLDQDKQWFFPVLAGPEDLVDGHKGLRNRLKLGPDELAEPLSLVEGSYAWAQSRLFYVTDSLERADDVAEVARAITSLSESMASVCLTCRPEAWQEARKILAFEDHEVVATRDIGREEVSRILGSNAGPVVEHGRFLQQPIFLDIALYLRGAPDVKDAAWNKWLTNPTVLLDAFRNWSIETRGDGARGGDQLQQARRRFLVDIARAQLRLQRFEVGLEEICGDDPARLYDAQEYAKHFSELRPIAVVTPRPGKPDSIRLRHDIVDSHNVASHLLVDDVTRRKRLLPFKLGFDQIVFEGVAQTAHDAGRQEILAEFFTAFLRAIDNKSINCFKPASWNMGYVIQAKLEVFERLLRHILQGSYDPQLAPPSKGAPASRLNPPLLGTKALSSVASMFLAADPLSIADPDHALLRALESKIHETRFRARLIDALAKIDDAHEVFRVLEKTAQDHANVLRDQPVSQYLASAMAEVARKETDLLPRAIVAVDGLIALLATSDKLQLTVARALHDRQQILYEAARRPPPPQPAFSAAEFVEGLSVHDVDRFRQYSDWIVFESYCRRLRSITDMAAVNDTVLLQLGNALWHQHVRCQVDAMTALGYVDRVIARGILLHALTFVTNDSVENAIFESLKMQVNRLLLKPGNEQAAFLRALRRCAAVRFDAVHKSSHRRKEILELVELLPDDPGIVSANFTELRHLSPAVSIVVQADVAPGLPPWLTEIEANLEVGKDKEDKVSLQSIQNDASLLMHASKWTTPRRVHKALLARAELPAILDRTAEELSNDDVLNHDAAVKMHVEAAARAYEAWVASVQDHFELAGMGVVHAILTTSDDEIVVSQRSRSSNYFPGAFSSSLEEQMILQDLDNPTPLAETVRRGIDTELGVKLPIEAIEVLAVVVGLEWPLMNPSILLHARVSLDAHTLTSKQTKDTDGELSQRLSRPKNDIAGRVERSALGFWRERDSAREHRLKVDGWAKLHPTGVARAALLDRT